MYTNRSHSLLAANEWNVHVPARVAECPLADGPILWLGRLASPRRVLPPARTLAGSARGAAEKGREAPGAAIARAARSEVHLLFTPLWMDAAIYGWMRLHGQSVCSAVTRQRDNNQRHYTLLLLSIVNPFTLSTLVCARVCCTAPTSPSAITRTTTTTTTTSCIIINPQLTRSRGKKVKRSSKKTTTTALSKSHLSTHARTHIV